VEKGQETTTPTTPEMNGPAKPQEKKGSKFFAFLSCCSSPDVDGDDSTVPPKKTSKQPPVSNRLPTPDKAEAHTGDSSTAESRDPAYFGDEKVVAVTADHPQPQEEERNAQVSSDTRGEGASTAASQPDVLPVDSKEHEPKTAVANGVITESKTDVAKADEQIPATENVTPNETTPKKPVAAEGETQSHEEEVVQAPVVLPPPPPPPAPEVTTATEGAEQQQWLLPPALPHLSNRKCLVLDLDETLVHSSFKVSAFLFSGSSVWNTSLTHLVGSRAC
jgi:RNA polymerase II subunit A small phosphatase-like protein